MLKCIKRHQLYASKACALIAKLFFKSITQKETDNLQTLL